MELSKAQLEYFNTFGFLKFSGLFKKDISKITEEFETVWIASNGGHHNQQHDFQRRSSIIHFIDINVFLSSLIDDPRITGPVSSILGDDFNISKHFLMCMHIFFFYYFFMFSTLVKCR